MDQYSELRLFIARVRRRWRVRVAVRAVARAAAAAALVGLAGLGVYWLFSPAGVPLVLLASSTALGVTAVFAAIVWRMPRRPGDRQVARFIEERVERLDGVQSLDDALVSAVDGADSSRASQAVLPLLVGLALQRLQGLTPGRVVPASWLRRSAGEAVAAAAIVATVAMLGWAPLMRAIETAWVAFFPETVTVSVLPGDTRVVAGQPLTIRAVVQARNRVLTHVTPAITVSAGPEQRTRAMLPAGDDFVFGFESVDRTFRYRVTAGSARSEEYGVTALFPPRVQRIDLHYRYPAFTGLSPRDEEDGGDIYAPAGTRVRIRIHTDAPVASGGMAFAAAAVQALRPAGDRILEADLVLSRDDSYRVRLAGAEGLASTGDTEYFIRLMDDRPPDVRILRPSGDQQISPLEEVVVEARADDDYGIAKFELVYAVPGGTVRTVPFTRVSGTDVAKVGAFLLAAEDLRVQPGDVITYYARAVDVARGKRPTETKSDMYFLEVRPFSEEFVAAQSQAGGGGAAGAQIESLIAAQKEIISATWNIERRSNAGRSAADLTRVAEAQAELKSRAEQMMSRGGRGRSPFQIPQQVGPAGQMRQRGAGGGSGVGAAIQAMERALEHLQAGRTEAAIPHEMAALQGLLQAQAEVRRRQVMQQQASGGSGGYGRQGQDLSALFDKELQRQQRTNYETRSQVDERPEQRDNDSALERIRDLARRQEDLSRRQRELADSSLTAEELKRQLERLTREQTELREQVEEVARQMGQSRQPRDGRSQQQGQRSDGQQADGSAARGAGPGATHGERQSANAAGRSEMREASEQMQSAAGELRRQEPVAAAARSARAAEQLRQIEQQLRGDSPEARQRMTGEMQLEARQIAGDQRRIAAEAGRLDRGDGGANADARRRLAGEKERLADRVDALQRAVSAAAKEEGSRRDGGGRSGDIIDAARELERQQLGRHMRETAKTIRDGGGTAAADASASRRSSQAAEEQIAKSLDKIAEQLGGGVSASRQLSAQLDQTRGIRDRLDRLESQMRDAEAREQTSSPTGAGEAGRQGQARRGGRQGQAPEGAPGGSAQRGELERLREEYARELQRARETLDRLQQGAPQSGQGGSTPERHEWSQSAPGNEAFKQDFSTWEGLRREVDTAIARHDAAVSAQAARKAAEDRLSAGGSDSVPEGYRRAIARYYEALARSRK